MTVLTLDNFRFLEGRKPNRNGFQDVQKGLPGKAAASEKAKRTLRYVEPLSDVRTKLEDFFNILIVEDGKL